MCRGGVGWGRGTEGGRNEREVESKRVASKAQCCWRRCCCDWFIAPALWNHEGPSAEAPCLGGDWDADRESRASTAWACFFGGVNPAWGLPSLHGPAVPWHGHAAASTGSAAGEVAVRGQQL